MDKKEYCENICLNRIKCEVSNNNLKNAFQSLYDNFNYWDEAYRLKSLGCPGAIEFLKQFGKE